MKALDYIVAILLIIGGLNWGLVGLFNFNLVEFFFASLPVLVKVIYILVGLSAVYQIFLYAGVMHHHEKIS